MFTSIALLNNLTGPLINFPYIINAVLEAYVSVRRLQRFLRIPSPPPSSTPPLRSPYPPPPRKEEGPGEVGEESKPRETRVDPPPVYTFEGGTFAVSGAPVSETAADSGELLDAAQGGGGGLEAATAEAGTGATKGPSSWRLHVPDLAVPAGAVVAVTGEVRHQRSEATSEGMHSRSL